MNVKNFKLVLDKIKSDPEHWQQSDWHCGTKHCFAGWAQILSGKPANNDTVRHDARIFLDLDSVTADYCFAYDATIKRLESVLDGRDGYDRAGYDRDGYDRDGLDKNNKPKS